MIIEKEISFKLKFEAPSGSRSYPIEDAICEALDKFEISLSYNKNVNYLEMYGERMK